MPPIKKYDKERILDLALEITKNEGLDSVNARRLAKKLNSSVQPIFHNFKNMEELKEEVYKRIYQKYKEYMLRNINQKKAYKQMGMNYIEFARDYPEYFKMIFMKKTNFNAENFIMADEEGNDVILIGQKLTGLSLEEQKKFHVPVWIFTHGIACLVATNTIHFSEEEISHLLESTIQDLMKGYRMRGKENGKNN